MIVCVCRRLNSAAVTDAVTKGARCPDSVQAHHGQTFNCGRCRETMSRMIADQVESAMQPQDMLAAE